ncbi:MAG TPA: hypothetical protein DGG94_09155 [Micromonosporaceae bacterium]|nr:hypothetical protein [Micromonosporaceae bacterium]HCU49951.1 hypothetical protein [Micromonosporaceae bacterium]
MSLKLRSFWPVAEAAQSAYETLRSQVLDTGALPQSLAAAQFARRGLAGLIAWPATEPVFHAELLGARRARWSPHTDARAEALAAGFALILASASPLANTSMVSIGQVG